ncbi:MAG: DUF3168 domain-containing protein [Mesorhizobium sp.]
MSVSAALQKLLYEALRADTGVSAMVGGRVYDRIPADAAGQVTAIYPHIGFGAYDFVPDDSDCIFAGEHTIQLDIWSRAVGKVEAKTITDAVRRLLRDYEADMGDYGLVEMRVDLAQVIGDPDGLTSHGIVQVTALIEEPE